MAVYSTRIFILLMSISVIVGIAGATLMPPAMSHYLIQPQVGNLMTHKVWYVQGQGDELLGPLVSRMNNLGIRATSLDASIISTNETLRDVSSPNSLVMLDGNWMTTRVSDNSTLAFLKSVSSQHGKLVVVGGSTPSFFDALKNAAVYEFPNGRNPANGNYPLAGFRLKIGSTPTGAQYDFPSLLFSNTTSDDGLLEAVNSWISDISK